MGIFGKKPQRSVKSIELGTELFRRISDLLSTHGRSGNSAGIAYFKSEKSDKQELEVVGESFFQEEIKQFEPENWFYGFLVPEQNNLNDPNAVLLYLINDKYEVSKVGYLKREMAKKVSQEIANMMVNDGLVIPVLAIVKKGPNESVNLGVRAYAMTDYLTF